MKTMFVVCGILFIVDGLYSMYITDRKDIPSKPCDIIPKNSSLPCKQYIISDLTYCEEKKLRKLFPGLYNRIDPDWPNWPAKVENVEQSESSVTWAVTPDGNINYLKGFQVIQEGTSFDTFGLKQCNVIDLSEMLKSDLNLLMEVKFTIINSGSGSYFAEIKPLPMRPEHLQPGEATVSIEPNKTFDVYHPQINVSMEYFQINTTAVNISVTVDGETQELDTLEIMVTQDGHYLENVAKRFDISQGSFLISGLKEGSYKVKLTPLDPHILSGDSDCVCFFGTNENRQCANCMGYTKTIQIQQQKETITEEDSMVGVILAPIVVITLLVIIALSVWLMWKRDKLPSLISSIPASRRPNNSSDFTSIEEAQLAKQPTLRLIYTYDHEPHVTAVNSLASLIQNSTQFQIISDGNDEPTASLLSSENSISIVSEALVSTADVLCVVHSDWAYKLVSVIGSGEVSVADLTNKEDKKFLVCMNEICQNPTLTSKIVSVRFEYTPENAVIRDPFLGPQFHLTENTEAFVKHLHSRTDSLHSNPVNISDKMALFSSINASFVYQSKHKSWLFSKLFYLKNSPSSDDSGVFMPRPCQLRSRSIRSRSADTVSYPQCTCDVNSKRTICSTCHQKQASRLRTYSCDLSFYPPESILDGTSEHLSLLESKFYDINSRYHQTLDGKDRDEDCFTLDGQSV